MARILALTRFVLLRLDYRWGEDPYVIVDCLSRRRVPDSHIKDGHNPELAPRALVGWSMAEFEVMF